MASWTDVSAAAPDLAERARARFEAHGLALLATLRRDGSPRISGIEVTWWNGELWLGMMPGSSKVADLHRDPRLALHAATADKDVKDGDAKLSGRAVEVDDDATKAGMMAAAFGEGGGPPGPFHLFRVDVTDLSFLRGAGDHLVIDVWKEGTGAWSVDRY